MPDILVYTYAYGHSYNQSLEHMIELISSLQTKKKESLINSIKMGYILHYFQDFFTYPHNTNYPGTIVEHGTYEMSLLNRIRKGNLPQTYDSFARCMNKEELLEYIMLLHASYETKPQGIENDLFYITQVTNDITSYLQHQFQMNATRTPIVEELVPTHHYN